jgi:hypothetical protein
MAAALLFVLGALTGLAVAPTVAFYASGEPRAVFISAIVGLVIFDGLTARDFQRPRRSETMWRERMGVEPTRDDAGRPATVLKTAETTGPPPLPFWELPCTSPIVHGANSSVHDPSDVPYCPLRRAARPIAD